MNGKSCERTAFVRWFSGTAVIILFIAACAGVQQVDGTDLFTLHKGEISIPAERNAASAKLSFNLIEASQSGTLQRLVRKLLYNGQSAGTYQRKMIEAWQRDFLKVLTEHENYTAQWTYEEVHNFVVRGHFAVLYKNAAWYQGGAHPDWYEQSYVIDLASPRVLKLEDLVTEKGLALVNLAADRELRRLQAIMGGKALPPSAPLSGGIYFDDKIPLSKDFAPAENGLNFQWDPYEIAPYSFGAIEITLTWNELETILTPLGKELEAGFKK